MRFSLPLLYLLLLGVVLSSCNKPVLNENGTLPANSLGVLFTDTLTVRSFTVREDTVRADNQAVCILGSMNDPAFGKSFASVYTQFALPIANLYLGTNVHVTRTLLVMPYLGGYGNTKLPIYVRVYRMAELMYVDSTYNSARTFAIQPTLIGPTNVVSIVPDFTDSIYNHYKDDTLGHPPGMQIELGQAIGQDILGQQGTSNTVDNNSFQTYFNGLYITTDTTHPGGGMVYLDLRSTETQLKIFYSADGIPDTVISFYVTPSSAQTVNHYQHNYANSSVASVLGSTNPNGDSMVFTQAMAGVKAFIKVPYIKNLGNIAISKAELMLTGVSDHSVFGDPDIMLANGTTPTGADSTLDDQLIGNAYFGGYKLGETVGGVTVTRYRLDLARYYQGLVQGKIDSGIYIFPTPVQRIADREAFGGGTHSKYKLKLNLTYSIIH